MQRSFRLTALFSLIFLPQCSFAQAGVDFSGFYVRTKNPAPKSAKKKAPAKDVAPLLNALQEASPLVLDVRQNADGVKVTMTQNETCATNFYPFHAAFKSYERKQASVRATEASIRNGALHLSPAPGTTWEFAGTPFGALSGFWTPSPPPAGDGDVDTFGGLVSFNDRKPRGRDSDFHENALARFGTRPSRSLSLSHQCVCLQLPPGAEPRMDKKGAALGFTLYREGKTTVTFDAGISGSFFDGLEREAGPGSSVFAREARRSSCTLIKLRWRSSSTRIRPRSRASVAKKNRCHRSWTTCAWISRGLDLVLETWAKSRRISIPSPGPKRGHRSGFTESTCRQRACLSRTNSRFRF